MLSSHAEQTHINVRTMAEILFVIIIFAMHYLQVDDPPREGFQILNSRGTLTVSSSVHEVTPEIYEQAV